MSSDRIGRDEPYLFPHRSPGAVSPLSQELSGVVWTRCALSRRAPWTDRHLTLLQIQTCKHSKIVVCRIVSKHISKTPLDAKIQHIIIEENIQYRQPNKSCRNTKSFTVDQSIKRWPQFQHLRQVTYLETERSSAQHSLCPSVSKSSNATQLKHSGKRVLQPYGLCPSWQRTVGQSRAEQADVSRGYWC